MFMIGLGITVNEQTRDPRKFWRDVLERIIRAFAQGMLATLVIGWRTFDKGGLPWLDSFYIGLGCAVIALLLSMAGGKFGDINSGSFIQVLGKKENGTDQAPAD